jgi:type III restriction enzyme
MAKETAVLYEKIASEVGKQTLKKIELPAYLAANLKHDLFDWQKEALQYFLAYENPEHGFKKEGSATHLMFNMATGTGKTLVMAALLLHYYKQGYRHVLFFVNTNNIVGKTEANLMEASHPKYLFKDRIVINDETIILNKVEVFSNDPQGMEIKFTTIQQLYNDVHLEKENQTTLDDLHQFKLLMLADEAHHLNADTNKKAKAIADVIDTEITERTSAVEIEKRGWEHMVIDLILHKNQDSTRGGQPNENVLLEFTATVPELKAVAEKYQDKIIFKFDLKAFLKAGYTKEINLIATSLGKKERALQALLFQWYRHQMALKHGVANFKPVILFRSKGIAESRTDYEDFIQWMSELSVDDFDFLKHIQGHIKDEDNHHPNEQPQSRIAAVIALIKRHEAEGKSFGLVVDWLKQSFQEKNVIITNSKTNNSQKEKTDEQTDQLLNNLEAKGNTIRAIFTVQRLTEGWDVLNLFDIVRLYEGRDEGTDSKGKRKAGAATVSEKQLIGRGVRYFPFGYADKIRNKRKFDDDLHHELRALEELYFHSTNESRYLDELKRELKKEGFLEDNKVIKTFDLKSKFKNSDFFKKTKVFVNHQIDNPNRRKTNLEDICNEFEYTVKGFEMKEEQVDFDEQSTIKMASSSNWQTVTKSFKEIEKHIVQKAIHIKAKQDQALFQFEHLKKELQIESMDELHTDTLADFSIHIICPKELDYDAIGHDEKLSMVLAFLNRVFGELKKVIVPKIGTEFTSTSFSRLFLEPKVKSIDITQEDKSIPKHDWYVLDGFVGSSEEVALVDFIKKTFGNLQEHYEEIYLLRNEEVYKIYDFKTGQGFQPDFILFLKTKSSFDNGIENSPLIYQVFIEPKGAHLLEYDQWKEDFLKEISAKYGLGNIINAEDLNYRLIGLPFYNSGKQQSFDEEFQRLVPSSNI